MSCKRQLAILGRFLCSPRKAGKGRILVVVVLTCLVGAAALLMTQEQEARAGAESFSHALGELLDSGTSLTPEEVHQQVGRTPHATRVPAKHRYVEEYRWKGPMGSHTVYAYYRTGATKLLEAVALNQTLPDWETEP